MAGSFVYLVLFPRPADQLMSNEWPAPAVATWKAVAELFQVGFRAIPEGTPTAMAIAAIAALVLVFVEKLTPAKYRKFTLSPASIGLAFVVHAHYSITMFIGAVIGLILARTRGKWTAAYLVVICAGIIAGESLTGVGVAFSKIDFATILEQILG
jgi:ABC-type iron transport system FetAB permease component